MDEKEKNVIANEAVSGGLGTIKIGDKTFLVDQVTDKIMGTLHNFIRTSMKSPLSAIANSLKDLPPEMQKFAISEAVKLQANGGAEGNAAFFKDCLLSIDGCGFLMWLLVKKNHPELSQKLCCELVKEASPEAVMADLGPACGLVAVAPEGN